VLRTVKGPPPGHLTAISQEDESDCLMLVNASYGVMLRRWFGHTCRVTSLAISKDGETIVSGSADETMVVSNRRSGERQPLGAVILDPLRSRLDAGSGVYEDVL